ncbi:hypothetical protein GGTG_10677 [Gaeumannomyces tritici R3-111a-1]|uniref:Uncharacterized protein n=1 Tax=Gaeumannomyces tritici (strain R3-111a-1) TaxID=644352 RepID=J3PB03_GAET3|nr:hypothetical protein GGTG_10677 [Gaeumannomyces tritici R3-111a-1]EJT71419.1 hypothetical protein GGTG_10677 [Gaeumannomyces tritici R3-111a-1]
MGRSGYETSNMGPHGTVPDPDPSSWSYAGLPPPNRKEQTALRKASAAAAAAAAASSPISTGGYDGNSPQPSSGSPRAAAGKCKFFVVDRT